MEKKQILVDKIDRKQRRYLKLCTEGLNSETENPEEGREFELMYRAMNSGGNLELAKMEGNWELVKCIEDYIAMKNSDPYKEYKRLHKRKKVKPTEFIKEVEYVKIIGRLIPANI